MVAGKKVEKKMPPKSAPAFMKKNMAKSAKKGKC